MHEKHHDSMIDDEEPMEAPAPNWTGHRKKFDAFERELTGGHHIGHLPVYVAAIEGWTFRRCRCGFSLALTPGGAIWWLRTTKDSVELKSFKVVTARAEFQLLGTPAARAAEACGGFATDSCGNCGGNPRSASV